MPAAAVIPAPIAYIKVVAVKKLVVGFLGCRMGPRLTAGLPDSWRPIRGKIPLGIKLLRGGNPPFTVKKLECSKQA